MFTLIVICLCVALVGLGRRYWLLRRGVHLLAAAVARRKAFLHDDNELPQLHPTWHRLATECSLLLDELAGATQQRAGHLNQLRTTLGSLREGVLVVDRDNYILLANPAVQRIFPVSREVVGQRLEVILHSVEILELLGAVRRSEDPSPREIEFREGGKPIWVEATGALVPGSQDENGPWALFVLHDITRLKELENVRKEFVANVSHELKTPITMLKGYAETLAEDDGTMLASDRQQFASTIQRHAERLSAIVEDLLTLSRLESGVQVLQASWQPVSPLLRAAAEEFADSYARSGHILKVVCEADGLEAHLDGLRLGQVFTNLLQNAQKYTPRGTPVEIGARAMEEGHEIEFWVSDEGPGIPAADLPRIFERFYRVEKGRSREKGGTGLGLSIVKHIVHLHGGQIAVDSRVGQGTRMSFRVAAQPVAAGSVA